MAEFVLISDESSTNDSFPKFFSYAKIWLILVFVDWIICELKIRFSNVIRFVHFFFLQITAI